MSKYTSAIEKLFAQAEEDGFQRGLKYARDALSAPRGNGTPPVTKKKRRKSKKARKAKVKPAGMTVEQRVLDAVEENEGKTGAQIIKIMGDVNPRTARTMLRRLRLTHKIEKQGEGWYKK
jgi:hypothetical protein